MMCNTEKFLCTLAANAGLLALVMLLDTGHLYGFYGLFSIIGAVCGAIMAVWGIFIAKRMLSWFGMALMANGAACYGVLHDNLPVLLGACIAVLVFTFAAYRK